MAVAVYGFACSLPALAQTAPRDSSAVVGEAPRLTAQGDPSQPSVPVDPTDQNAVQANLDDLLDMDLDTLSKVSVLRATDTNPIVEAVSRKKETLAESPGVVEVITAEEIRGFGAKTLRDVLVRGTSIWTPNSAFFPNNVLSMRGDLPGHYDTHVLLLLNGRPFKDTLIGGADHPIYAAFPIESLERIEIIRGPGSVLYGTNAYAGVINLITKNPVESADSFSALAGSMSTQRYEVSQVGGNEQKNLLIGAMYLRDNGFKYSAFDEVGHFDTTNFAQENVGVVGVYNHGPFTLNAFVAQADQPMMGNSLVRWRDDGFLLATRVFLDASYTIGDPKGQSLETHFTYNFVDSVFWGVPPYTVPEHLLSHDYLIEPIYRLAISEDLSLMFGGTVEFRQGESRLPTVPAYSRIWYSVYGQFDYRVTEWLKLVGGMQGNMPGQLKSGIVPRAGVIVSLTDQWTVKALYGGAFRSPAAIETDINVSAIIGNPNLAPETIDTYDIQLAYSNDNARVAATYFSSRYSDMISRDRTHFPPTYGNLGELDVQGMELEARTKIGPRLPILGSATWQENESSDGVFDTTHVPNWMANVGVLYESKSGLTLGVFDSYFSAPPSVANTDPGVSIVNPIPSACHLLTFNSRLDLSRYLHRPSRTFEVQFMIQNLLDEEVWHPEFSRRVINSVPAEPGRTFYGGFTLSN
jgi:outer membrane receptor for ferrienterochelin and colicins